MRRFAVVEEPISAAALREVVAAPGCGAICCFEGTVRDHTKDSPTDHLEYEAHPEMAEQIFAKLADTAGEQWPGIGVAIHHRVGRLEIGEVSVAIAVSSEHRADAFEACRYLIDQLKVSAPIWKKEFGPDGSHWVEGPVARDPDDDGRISP